MEFCGALSFLFILTVLFPLPEIVFSDGHIYIVCIRKLFSLSNKHMKKFSYNFVIREKLFGGHGSHLVGLYYWVRKC